MKKLVRDHISKMSVLKYGDFVNAAIVQTLKPRKPRSQR